MLYFFLESYFPESVCWCLFCIFTQKKEPAHRFLAQTCSNVIFKYILTILNTFEHVLTGYFYILEWGKRHFMFWSGRKRNFLFRRGGKDVLLCFGSGGRDILCFGVGERGIFFCLCGRKRYLLLFGVGEDIFWYKYRCIVLERYHSTKLSAHVNSK